jgi:NAD(P)-dependent dehydrogenase (short-subunit alcohol dehydrogenase family)
MPSMIVTGAAHGLGKNIAEHAARAGYKVGVLDLVLGEAQKVADDIGGIALAADVSDASSVENAFSKFDEVPDVLINNAGILCTGPLLDHDVEDFRRVIDINLSSVFIVAQIAARRMKDNGGGCIINMSSVNGINPSTNCGAYATAKTGVIALTKQMSMEWGEYNIRVNSIAPGFIDAGMQAPFFENEDVRRLRSNSVPLKRLGSAKDVAECALFLASEKAGYISGENITIDGGVIHSVLMQLPRS